MNDDDLQKRLDAIADAVDLDEDPLTVECLWSHEKPKGEPDVLIRQSLVMTREEATRRGIDILGSADTPTDEDTVRVDPESWRAAGGYDPSA